MPLPAVLPCRHPALASAHYIHALLMIMSRYLKGDSRLYKQNWWLIDKTWLQSLKNQDMTVSSL